MNKLLTTAAILGAMMCYSPAQANEKMAEQGKEMMKETAMQTKDKAMMEKAGEASKEMQKGMEMEDGAAAASTGTMEKGGKASRDEMMAGKEGMAQEKKAYIEVTAQDMKKMMEEEKNMIIIDARSEKDYKAGHIEKAINMTPDKITKESMMKVAKDMNSPIAFYCGSVECPASAKAAKKASEMGYKNIYKFTGGMAAWKESGYSVKM